jgi:hypothetical protein
MQSIIACLFVHDAVVHAEASSGCPDIVNVAWSVPSQAESALAASVQVLALLLPLPLEPQAGQAINSAMAAKKCFMGSSPSRTYRFGSPEQTLPAYGKLNMQST